jgi:glutathione-regulated potassium-efflux system ancillary protein KefG
MKTIDKVILVASRRSRFASRQMTFGRGMMSQTAKVLLLYAHPESQDSVANRVLLEPALQLPNVTVHDLYAHYPDFFIDIAHEQDLLRQHQVIVFQHPLYTWSCPALLKEWLDRVLSRAGGNQLAGKYWRSVITTGEPESAYRRDANRYPMNDILRPFELTAGMCRMHWLSPIIVYWARRQRPEDLQSHARAYRDWLANPVATGGVNGGS